MALININKIDESPILKQRIEKLEEENEVLRVNIQKYKDFVYKFFQSSGMWDIFKELNDDDYLLKPNTISKKKK